MQHQTKRNVCPICLSTAEVQKKLITLYRYALQGTDYIAHQTGKEQASTQKCPKKGDGICDRSLESRNFRKFHLRQKSPEWHVFQVASLWKIPPHPQNHFRVFSRVHWKKQNTTIGLDTLMNLLSVLITQLLALVI